MILAPFSCHLSIGSICARAGEDTHATAPATAAAQAINCLCAQRERRLRTEGDRPARLLRPCSSLTDSTKRSHASIRAWTVSTRVPSRAAGHQNMLHRLSFRASLCFARCTYMYRSACGARRPFRTRKLRAAALEMKLWASPRRASVSGSVRQVRLSAR